MDSTYPTTEANTPMLEPQARPRGVRFWVVGVVCVVAIMGGFYLGNNYQIVWSQGPVPLPTILKVNSADNPLHSPLFGQVQELMRTKYLRASELDQQEMLYGAIAGMVNSAGDPYTSFFDPEQNEEAESQLSGKYEGIGAELGYNDEKQLTVIAPIKDSPALKAGIRAGDIILRIDDKDTQNMTLTEAVALIRGEANTEVALTILHKGADSSEVITITRQQITITSVDLSFEDNPETEAKDSSIAYIKLSRFGDTTDTEWDKAVDEVISRNARGLVLDLRNNPGGYLTSACVPDRK